MSNTAAPARYFNGRFGPGNPGRRAGTRNNVSHRATMAILEDFESHGAEVLGRLRRHFTPAYFAILVRLLDRQLQIETAEAEDLSDSEVRDTVNLARRALSLNENHRTALIELEQVLQSARAGPALEAHRINGD
jgi:hypothetical protein